MKQMKVTVANEGKFFFIEEVSIGYRFINIL